MSVCCDAVQKGRHGTRTSYKHTRLQKRRPLHIAVLNQPDQQCRPKWRPQAASSPTTDSSIKNIFIHRVQLCHHKREQLLMHGGPFRKCFKIENCVYRKHMHKYGCILGHITRFSWCTHRSTRITRMQLNETQTIGMQCC